MSDLPFVDRHEFAVQAPPLATWEAVATELRRSTSGAPALARALGVQPEGPPDPRYPAPGTGIPGFRVAESAPGQRLLLEGSHRFSRYSLDFEIRPQDGGCLVTATTHAAFPGAAGKAYRALVIGTRGHVLVLRHMVRRAAARAGRRA